VGKFRDEGAPLISELIAKLLYLCWLHARHKTQ
jgi:hypothetical protein